MTHEELEAIALRNAPSEGPIQWAPTADVQKLVAEVRRLRALVETEYSRVHGQIHTTPVVAIQQASSWAAAEASFDSDARRALDGAK